MIMRQFSFDGCLSYVVASSGERMGAIIDPSHDPSPYLAFVKERNLQILYCIDTHTHVDHVSLAMELADALGARTVMSRNAAFQREIGVAAVNLPGIGKIIEENGQKRIDMFLEEKEGLHLGNIYLEALFTPGHTKTPCALSLTAGFLRGTRLSSANAAAPICPGETRMKCMRASSENLWVCPTTLSSILPMITGAT
jgi:sulfur dioxygenase